MSRIETPIDESPTEGIWKPGTVTQVKYCRSCWRNELHRQLFISPFMLGFLSILTLGLIARYRPSRCVCCGQLRVG